MPAIAHARTIAALAEHLALDVVGDDLGAVVSDPCGALYGRAGIVQRALEVDQIKARPRQHGQVGDLDAAKAAHAAQIEATTKIAVRAPHVAASIAFIAQAGERLRLELGRANACGAFERQPVLLTTGGEVAERKEDVAAQVVETRALEREIACRGQGLGLVESGERAVIVV